MEVHQLTERFKTFDSCSFLCMQVYDHLISYIYLASGPDSIVYIAQDFTYSYNGARTWLEAVSLII